MERLTDRRCATLKKPGKYGDGGNLYLKVTPTGTKSWVFRFATGDTKISKKKGEVYKVVEDMGLGGYPDIGLAAARDLATQQRALRRAGKDPIQHRKEQAAAAKVQEAHLTTFGQCVVDYISEKGGQWKNPKHRQQWQNTLRNDARLLWDLPVSAIDTPLLLQVLRPMWREKPETASRLRARIERVIGWAMVTGKRPEGANPARWRGHLQEALPQRPAAQHFRALPWQEIPALMAELRALDSISARALEITILTACRTSEVINAVWSEFDLKKCVWTVPASRTKSGRPHNVPLVPRVLEILRKLPREKNNPYVFIGGRSGRPLSDMAMLEMLRGLRPGFTVHGTARAGFRTWCSVRAPEFSFEIIEDALAHAIKSKTVRAYDRPTDAKTELRRPLMEKWNLFCKGKGK